ncbi:hypothetical protein [Paenibacillus agri]|uniref:Uncharacterized protein n=1 Tax=Paenibacillus agri TaxID=2744309 RepID=A0A850EHT5_9BACL|nr:hypothetical protein [Paenibacillus agri]NUU58974.1 hypothetical protein [Paenibacillus agri]
MEDMFNGIRKGLDAGVYQLALNMTLCIPDICAALESQDGKASGAKYQAWFDGNMAGKTKLSGSDCYYFRCAFLHQGTTEHEKSRFKKILFIEPTAMSGVFHNNVIDGVLNIDLRIFCDLMITSASSWYSNIKDDPTFKINYEKSFRRYPEGLAPYIVGIPVYA